MKPLQLIRDVETRWSSVYLMIDCAIILREAITRFLEEQGEEEELTNEDWETLGSMRQILQIPHTYQEVLCFEKTSTLCGTVPAFEGLQGSLEKLKAEKVDAMFIIQAGRDKLSNYYAQVFNNPAYLLAIVLNPITKLDWFKYNILRSFAESVKIKLLEAVSALSLPLKHFTIKLLSSLRPSSLPSLMQLLLSHLGPSQCNSRQNMKRLYNF
ncbi:hypothetical protein BJV78DRAFT_1135748 [Lactifluus subvellereus]|nr:hypothetical protein BJV78DRAFT_1135748 [Lactifluus subvellereus]